MDMKTYHFSHLSLEPFFSKQNPDLTVRSEAHIVYRKERSNDRQYLAVSFSHLIPENRDLVGDMKADRLWKFR